MNSDQIKITDKNGKERILTMEEFRRERGAMSGTTDITSLKSIVIGKRASTKTYDPRGDGVDAQFTDRSRSRR